MHPVVPTAAKAASGGGGSGAVLGFRAAATTGAAASADKADEETHGGERRLHARCVEDVCDSAARAATDDGLERAAQLREGREGVRAKRRVGRQCEAREFCVEGARGVERRRERLRRVGAARRVAHHANSRG